ncbi:MAG: Cobalt-zinc-cadmium resistance protein CzcA [Chthoniobacteraceae bacterium]|nr:Cobalt-zinc-cadmium resistance protein CzcA [Chthoniobacteraceae bacterium]
MNISEPFIRRPVGTSLLAAGLFILGIVAYNFLPVAPLPRVDFPMVQVSASLPGADPATMASSVAAPLERRFGQIAGVSEITSVSTLGGVSVTLQFDLDRKIDGAVRDVQAAINAAAGELPSNLPSPPRFRKINPADAPIMILTLTSDTLPATKVFDLADTIIAQRLSQIEGVSQVVINGAEKSAVRIQMNPSALASVGLSMEDVRNVLSQSNVNLAKGSIDGSETSYMIDSNDQLLEPADYRSIALAQRRGVPITLSALGTAEEGVENSRLAGWAGTKRAVLLIIFKQAGANVIETVDGIRAVLPQVERWVPPSVKLEVSSDRTTTIRASVHDVQFSMLLSIGLVVMVMFLFLRRFWPTFIASVTVPLALAGTFGAMYLLGFSLDNLSLMALTISVGFVVDDAIVVIENVFRFVEAGERPFQAALKGARQIGFTVVSISVSLIAVFIPLLFMGGLIGRLLHEFAVTLSLAIVISAVISLTLTPMMCSRFLRSHAESPPGMFHRVTEHFFTGMLDLYESGLRWVLKHQAVMLVITALTLVATIWLYKQVPKGFFPQQDTGMLMGTTDASQDISFPAMSKLQDQVTRVVLADPAVATVSSFIGAAGGSSTVNNGRMFITLKPQGERQVSADQVIARIRRQAGQIGGISLFMQAVQDIRVGGRMGKGQYQYALQASDLDELNQWSPKVLAKLRQVPLLKDVSTDQQTKGLESSVVIDRDAAARFGVTTQTIDSALYDAFGQRQVSTIYKRYNQHYVILEISPEFLRDPSSLDKIYVKSETGRMVPLSSVARFEITNAFLSVNHQSQFPAVTLSFNLPPGGSLGQATELVNKAMAELHVPSTVRGSFQGTAQVFQASLSTVPILVLAALLTVYVVLGMLYESLIHPLTILLSLPSAGVGALLALIYFRLDLSIVSFIGIILLIGIVKKNAIMMIDFALDVERSESLSPEDAIFKACVVRFRPIMMTTLAALFGTLPLAFGTGTGAELRRPLGIAVAGGLILSQILTLYTTPVIYLAFEHLRQRFSRSPS